MKKNTKIHLNGLKIIKMENIIMGDILKGKRKNKRRNSILVPIIAIFVLMYISLYLYDTYRNIEITEGYTAKKVAISTEYEQTVDNAVSESKKMEDVIEDISKSVCGISKLSDRGTAVLSTATEAELGLGTGVIISENGYILTNEHVSGGKYSKCYVTLENRRRIYRYSNMGRH